jgi:hypothetical protein
LGQGVFVFSFIGVFVFAVAFVFELHLGLLSALEVSRLWTRCLLGPDGDEWMLLSKGRPLTAIAAERSHPGSRFIATRMVLFRALFAG